MIRLKIITSQIKKNLQNLLKSDDDYREFLIEQLSKKYIQFEKTQENKNTSIS